MAVTSITGPNTFGGGNPFSQISNALAPLYQMFGSPTTGGGGGNVFGGGGGGATNVFGGTGGGTGGQFGLQTQPVSGGNNDLSQYQRSVMDLLGTSSAGLLQGGGNIINQGMGVTQGGVDVTGTGLDITGIGLGMFGSPYDYLTQLAGSDPSTVAGAAGPMSTIVSKQAANALNNAAMGGPAGGARAAVMAGLPQAQQQQVGQFELGLKPAAEQGLINMAQQVAGIGQGISGTGLNLGTLGQQMAQTGTTLTGQGIQGTQYTAEDILRKMGINIQGGTSATFGEWAKAISDLLGKGGGGGGGSSSGGLNIPMDTTVATG